MGLIFSNFGQGWPAVLRIASSMIEVCFSEKFEPSSRSFKFQELQIRYIIISEFEINTS